MVLTDHPPEGWFLLYEAPPDMSMLARVYWSNNLSYKLGFMLHRRHPTRIPVGDRSPLGERPRGFLVLFVGLGALMFLVRAADFLVLWSRRTACA